MASHEGERKNGMMEGENFPIQCCQVSSHCLGCRLPCFMFFLLEKFRNFLYEIAILKKTYK